MNYFKDEQNKVYAYDNDQIAQGYGSGLTEISPAEMEALVAPAPLSPEEQALEMERKLEAYTDEVAAQRRYRSAESCVSYRGASDTNIDAEANAFFDWRESMWAAAAAIEAEVLDDIRTAPTYEEAIAELPKMVWP